MNKRTTSTITTRLRWGAFFLVLLFLVIQVMPRALGQRVSKISARELPMSKRHGTWTAGPGRPRVASTPPTPTPTPTATPTPTPTPTPGEITLSAIGCRVRGFHTVDLTWSGAASANIDVYRNGAVVATTANDGFYTDSIGTKGRRHLHLQGVRSGHPNLL
jgi:hypothetical protein